MSKNRGAVWMPLLLSLSVMAGMIAGYSIKVNFNIPITSKKASPVNEVWSLLQQRYVDDLDWDTVGQAAIGEMLSKLDPHSVYLTATELKTANEEMEGHFEGIGVEYLLLHDTVTVSYVVKNGPADQAGLLPGDQLIKADTVLLSGVKAGWNEIRSYLRGPSGSTVKTTLLRRGEQKMILIKRGYIDLPSLDACYMIDANTGYIRINRFSETTYDEFMKGMQQLKNKGMQQLLLDLRNNPGGYLQAAVSIADEFLDNNKLITYTSGKHSEKKEYKAQKPGLFENGSLVVLADETSASASEVLFGALQDWDRAVIAGRRTFGKGLVQDQYQLHDGSALRLTVARYYTPSGRCIQKPYQNGEEAYEEELLSRYRGNQLINADSNTQHSGKSYFTLRLKRKVYAGGGISPDVFIAVDTSLRNPAFSKLYEAQTMNHFILDYFMSDPTLLKKLRTPADVSELFRHDPDIWNHFTMYCAKDSVNAQPFEPRQVSFIMQNLEALLARQIWRTEGYLQIKNRYDPEIRAALQAFGKPLK